MEPSVKNHVTLFIDLSKLFKNDFYSRFLRASILKDIISKAIVRRHKFVETKSSVWFCRSLFSVRFSCSKCA